MPRDAIWHSAVEALNHAIAGVDGGCGRTDCRGGAETYAAALGRAGRGDVDQWGLACSSSGGLRMTIGCLLVFCTTMNAIVPHTAGTQSEIA